MFTKKQLLIGIGLTVMGNAIMVTAANADDLSTTSLQGSNFVGPTNASNYSVGGIIAGEGLAGGISIPPSMTLPSTAAAGGNPGSSSSGIAGDTNPSNPSDTSNASSGSSTNGTITVADIAQYFAASIDQSLDGGDTFNVAQKPIRIVRRRSSASCPNPSIARPSESLDDLLSQSEEFLEEVNKLKPENSVW